MLPPFPPPASRSAFDKTDADIPTSESRFRSCQNRANLIYASFMIIASKALIHDDAVIRRKTSKRIREALRMIIIRGAKSKEDGTGLIFIEEIAGEEQWLVKGWSYVIFPKLEAYRAPWPELVTALRHVLGHLKFSAKKLSRQWSEPREADGSSPSPGKKAGQPPCKPKDKPASNNSQAQLIPITEASPKALMTAKKPQLHRAYSTKAPSHQVTFNRTGANQRRRDWYNARADVVLGTRYKLNHVASIFFPTAEYDPSIRDDDFLPLAVKAYSNTFGSNVVHDTEHWQDINFQDHYSYQIPFSECDASDAEGWIIIPLEARTPDFGDSVESQQVGDKQERKDDLHFEDLLDSRNLPRFLVPHLVHHAGRRYELKLQHEWSQENSATLRESTNTSYAEFVQQKFKKAAEARRKARKKLRDRWNVVDMGWLEELKQREIKRLEREHDVTIDRGKEGVLRAVPNKRDVEDPNAPWWAPRKGSLGWVDPRDKAEYSADTTPKRREHQEWKHPQNDETVDKDNS